MNLFVRRSARKGWVAYVANAEGDMYVAEEAGSLAEGKTPEEAVFALVKRNPSLFGLSGVKEVTPAYGDVPEAIFNQIKRFPCHFRLDGVDDISAPSLRVAQ